MNIVYLSQHFYPEMGAPSTRVLEMSSAWVKAGHQVTVVTCFPNHPTGVIPPQYRGRIFLKESYEGIRVFRNLVYATPNQGVIKRTISHLSFMFTSLFLSLPRLGKVDVIIVTSPPFFTALAALVMSWWKRRPFVFEVRDLWPAAIVELGVIKAKPIIAILESLELFLYRRASKVVVVTESFKEDLVKRGIPASKIEIIFNGVDPERFGRIDALTVKKAFGFEGRFIILYTGAVGLSHSLQTVVSVAKNFREQDFLFLLVGEGAMKKSLEELTMQSDLKNVIFWPGQPREKMPEIYALADICLVSLRKVPLFQKVIPSKIFEILASGRPVVAALEGEAARLLERSGAALVIPPEDLHALQEAIDHLAKNEALRQKMGENGAGFVRRYFDRTDLALQYETVLGSVLASRGKPYRNYDLKPWNFRKK